MNSRISVLNSSEASDEVKNMLSKIQESFGTVPNIFRVMANSETTLKSLLNFSNILSSGTLDRDIAERIAILSAVENGCEYCLAAHSHIAKSIGVSEEEICLSQNAQSTDSRIQSALYFARSIIRNKGLISDQGFNDLRSNGFSDSEILEIIANVSLNIFTNYINNANKTAVDFPPISSAIVGSL